MSGVSSNILLRVYILFGMFVLFGVVIILRVAALQVNKEKWMQKETEEQVFFKRVMADRGSILAADGSIMAASIPYFRLAMDVTVMDTNEFEVFKDTLMDFSARMANYFDPEVDTMRYYNKVMEAIQKEDRHIYLTRKTVNFKELEMVRKWPLLNRGRYGAGFIEEKLQNKRYYPYGALAQITLGRLVDDTVGVRGIEYSFNEPLRGRDGYVLAQKIAGKSYIPLNRYGEKKSYDGYDIHTTLDVDLQDVVENAIQKAVETHKAKYGAAILLDVKTGAIRAIANYPEEYNYAIATRNEPGSTFKLASALASLEAGIVELEDTVDTGDGVVQYDDKKIRDGYALGRISYETVFAKSSNVGMSRVAYHGFKKDTKAFYRYMDQFGFDQPANVQIAGEPNPLMIRPGDELWNATTIPSMAIGYSIQLTPLQIAAFYNAVANNGKLMQPYLISSVSDGVRDIESFGPVVVREQIASPETIEKAHILLKAVVEKGTAKFLSKSDVPMAGKTGTARKAVNGKYRNIHQASFAGFFPADKPRYTCYVLVDEPTSGSIYGSQVAAPVFQEIAEEIYGMDMRLSEPIEKKSDAPLKKPAPKAIYAESAEMLFDALQYETSMMPEGTEWVRTATSGHQINYAELDLADGRVPDVRGMSPRDAVNLLETLGLNVSLRGVGKVQRQSLLPGYKFDGKGNITLFLG